MTIHGRVVPSTAIQVKLAARAITGATLIGETRVGTSADRLRSLMLNSANPTTKLEAVRAIEGGDMIVIAAYSSAFSTARAEVPDLSDNRAELTNRIGHPILRTKLTQIMMNVAKPAINAHRLSSDFTWQ